jgi:hypothetical protein
MRRKPAQMRKKFTPEKKAGTQILKLNKEDLMKKLILYFVYMVPGFGKQIVKLILRSRSALDPDPLLSKSLGSDLHAIDVK